MKFQHMASLAALALLAACSGTDLAQNGEAQNDSQNPAQPQQARYQQPQQPARPQVHMVSVPAGTELTLALDSTLSSETSQVGDSFTATVIEPIVLEDRTVIPEGSKIHGKVTEATPAKRGAGQAKLSLAFSSLRLTSGFDTAITGSFQEITESKKSRNAKVIGGSAAGGALLGRILGKNTKGAVIGAIVGGGIGTAVVVGQEREQAVLPARHTVRVQARPAGPGPPRAIQHLMQSRLPASRGPGTPGASLRRLSPAPRPSEDSRSGDPRTDRRDARGGLGRGLIGRVSSRGGPGVFSTERATSDFPDCLFRFSPIGSSA